MSRMITASLQKQSALYVGILVLLIVFLYPQRSEAKVEKLSFLSASDQAEAITINDSHYGYSFRIPSTWYAQMEVTPARWSFFSDPTAVYDENSESLHAEVPSGGLIYMEFSVDPVPNWLPAPIVRNPRVDELGNATSEELIPLLPPGTWTTVAGLPALIVSQDEKQLTEGDGDSFVKATSVYILAERMVYYLWIAYAPPTVGNKVAAESHYDEIVTLVLDSFEVNSEAPATWRPQNNK